MFESGSGITFRSLDFKKDIHYLHRWVNLPYSTFWDLAGPKEVVTAHYKEYLGNSGSHSFMGLCAGKRVCLVDLYLVQSGELGECIRSHPSDCGMHLLMAPSGEREPGVTELVMQSFLAFYFSFPQAGCLYAEPDIHNHKACRLLERSGFIFQRNIMLPSKAASLYLITRGQFGG